MITLCMLICLIASEGCPCGLLGVNLPLFAICLVHVCLQILFGYNILYIRQFVCLPFVRTIFASFFCFSLCCSTKHTRNSLESTSPPRVSSTLSLPTFSSMVTTSVMVLQTSGSTSCAVILPEFLASVIQAI